MEYLEEQLMKCILEHRLYMHCLTIMPNEGLEVNGVGFRLTLAESEWWSLVLFLV
jgi:hypothetical protein